ncbi:MAG: tetratricopeptide repeat protein, partial [Candidatus Sigynarchaeum springense]
MDPRADGTLEGEHALLRLVEKGKTELDGSSASLERLLQAFSNLGGFYQLSGHLDEAETTYKEAIDFKVTCAPEMVDANVMFVLSSIHTELGIVDRKREKFADAVPQFEAALDIRKKLAEENPVSYNSQLAEAWNNIGTAMRKVGKHGEALKAFQQALEMRKELVASGTPESHHDLANTYASMGTLFREQGNLEESKAAFEAALDAHKKIPAGQVGPFMATRANLFNNLGVVKGDLKDFEGALESFRKALAIYEKAGGTGAASRMPEMAMVCNNMASAYQATGQLDAAERAFL